MYLNWLFTNYKLQNIDFVIMLLFPQYNNYYPYKIKFSGIPSGSKSIKCYPASGAIFIHTCDIIFNQSVHSIFARCQPLVIFSSFGVL